MSVHPCGTPAGMMMMSPVLTTRFTTSRAGDHAAARRSVQLGRHLRIRRRLAAVDDVAAGDERAAAGDDEITFGLRIVGDAAGRRASRRCRRLLAAPEPACRRRGRRPRRRLPPRSAPRPAAERLRLRPLRAARAAGCAAMDDADREVLVADVDDSKCPIHTGGWR